MAGIARVDCNCNQDIRQRFCVATIAEKLRGTSSQWYGKVLRDDNGSVRKISWQESKTVPKATMTAP
ncbi:hypothetical protein Y032_0038g3657 [Ancylostoma ceylanicum]|uniref:Uncharacterized protein n=1 Tax=Ancylostoma ceylanicum TaxID=53326 RepID=A0A016UJR7_9BILA|nr:hypothetical protein Y032_0038g3657 [Ancylostoma ceylanicum]